MKRNLGILIILLGCFALVAQYILMIEYRENSILVTTIRFISFFTILTNLLVAVYFIISLFPQEKRPNLVKRAGALSAVTIYIMIVCLVYQVALRHLWQPKGLQRLVDELLHTIVPILVLIYWYLYDNRRTIPYKRIAVWAIYPLTYLLYTLVIGKFTDYYPYPFIDVSILGLGKALMNAGIIVILFLAISAAFIFIAKKMKK